MAEQLCILIAVYDHPSPHLPTGSKTSDHRLEAVLHEEDGMKSRCAVNLHNAVTVPSKDHYWKEDKPSCGRAVWKFFKRTTDVTEYRNAEAEVNPAKNRTFGGIFHD